MLRILAHKVVKNRSSVFFVILLLALLLFVRVNLNSQQLNRTLVEYESNLFQDHQTQPNEQNRTELASMDEYAATTEDSATTGSKEALFTTETTPNITRNTTSKPTTGDINSLHTTGYMIGHVHSHLWYKMCTLSLDSIREHPLFPLWPGARGQPKMPGELESITTELWAMQRVFGLLYPPISGMYRFKIISRTISEFWLSSSTDPRNATLLARNNRNPFLNVVLKSGPLITTSRSVYLSHGQAYYFEILHGINNVRRGKVRVRWMVPGNKTYTGIPNTSLSTLLEGNDHLEAKTRELLTSSASLHNHLQKSISKKHKNYHDWLDRSFSKPFQPYSIYTKDNLHTVKFANRWKIMSVFDECIYAPSYTVKRDYKRYQGVYNTHYSDVFPDDDTGDKYWEGQKTYQDTLGNTVIDEADVINVVNMFMAAVEAKFPGEYALANVVNVERNFDKERGNRFLLELILLEVETEQIQKVSEYVFQFHKKPTILCKPKGLEWSPTVKINAILTTKNQGPWVIHYIKNMAEIVHTTGDDNVHFIVVDYGNDGVDVAEEFRSNNITSFTVIKKTGKFHKTLAIDEAANVNKDNNSIVFLTDLHLVAPNNIFESVRKHTVQGRMTFTPVVFRLSHCSRPESKLSTPNGYWETFGYGLFSSYRSDWLNFGGVNVKEFQHKWGGEDWEMADRVLNKGIEIERLRIPYFYHFYHDKSGMWHQA